MYTMDPGTARRLAVLHNMASVMNLGDTSQVLSCRQFFVLQAIVNEDAARAKRNLLLLD